MQRGQGSWRKGSTQDGGARDPSVPACCCLPAQLHSHAEQGQRSPGSPGNEGSSTEMEWTRYFSSHPGEPGCRGLPAADVPSGEPGGWPQGRWEQQPDC